MSKQVPGPLVGGPTTPLGDALSNVRGSYEIAKKRAAELSALAVDCPIQLRSRLTLTSKLYLSLSTIFYTTLTSYQVGDLQAFIKESALQLPTSLFDMKEWEGGLALANDLRLRESQGLASRALSQDTLLLKGDVEVLKKKVTGQVDSMVSVFEQMKLQIISVLRDEESKIKRMETDLIEKDQIIRDNRHRWDISKQTASDESTRLHAYYENMLAEQKTRLVKEYDFSYEEKLIGVNKLYEERIKKLEEGHIAKMGELKGMMIAMKDQLDNRADEKRHLEEKMEKERLTSSINLSECMASNRAVLSTMEKRILELEDRNHQLVAKHSNEALFANERIAAVIAQMNENMAGLRMTYDQNLLKKEEEIATLKSDLADSNNNSKHFADKHDNVERKLREVTQSNELEVLRSEAKFNYAMDEKEKHFAFIISSKEKEFETIAKDNLRSHSVALDECNKRRNELQQELDDSYEEIQSNKSLISQLQDEQMQLISNHDRAIASKDTHISKLGSKIADLQREAQSNAKLVAQFTDKNNELQLSLDQLKSSQIAVEFKLRSSLNELQVGFDQIKDVLCNIFSSFKFAYISSKRATSSTANATASTSSTSPERPARMEDVNKKIQNEKEEKDDQNDRGEEGDDYEMKQENSQQLPNSKQSFISKSMSFSDLPTSSSVNAESCDNALKELMSALSITDVSPSELDLAGNIDNKGIQLLSHESFVDDAAEGFEERFGGCWAAGHIKNRVDATINCLSVFQGAIVNYFDLRNTLVEIAVGNTADLIETSTRFERLKDSYKVLSGDYTRTVTLYKSIFSGVKLSQCELLDAVAAINEEVAAELEQQQLSKESKVVNRATVASESDLVTITNSAATASTCNTVSIYDLKSGGGGGVNSQVNRGKALKLMGLLNLYIFSIEAQELVDKGSMLDKQDPMVRFWIGGEQFDTDRAKDAGTSASFAETFELEIDETVDVQFIEVEALNKSLIGNETSLGKGKVALKDLREYLVASRFNSGAVNEFSVDLFIDKATFSAQKRQGRVAFKFCVISATTTSAISVAATTTLSSFTTTTTTTGIATIENKAKIESQSDDPTLDPVTGAPKGPDKISLAITGSSSQTPIELIEINNRNVAIYNIVKNNASLITAHKSKVKSSDKEAGA